MATAGRWFAAAEYNKEREDSLIGNLAATYVRTYVRDDQLTIYDVPVISVLNHLVSALLYTHPYLHNNPKNI